MDLRWSLIAKPRNRQILSWLGSGLVALAAGAWVVVTYVWPAPEAAKTVCAQQGSISGGRDATKNRINYNGGASAGVDISGAVASCADVTKR